MRKGGDKVRTLWVKTQSRDKESREETRGGGKEGGESRKKKGNMGRDWRRR